MAEDKWYLQDHSQDQEAEDKTDTKRDNEDSENETEGGLKGELWHWVRDFIEVIITLAIILIILKGLLGAHMMVPLVAVTSCSMLHDDTMGTMSANFANSMALTCSFNNRNENWKEWISKRSNQEIGKLPLENGFAIGDMVLTITPDGKGTIHPFFPDTELGDVIIYTRDSYHNSIHKDPIIHRVVGVVNITDWKFDGFTGTIACLEAKDFDRYIGYVKNCVDGNSSCPYPNHPKTGTFRFYITKGDNNEGVDQCGSGGGIALPITDEQITARGWIRLPFIGYLKLFMNLMLGL